MTNEPTKAAELETRLRALILKWHTMYVVPEDLNPQAIAVANAEEKGYYNAAEQLQSALDAQN